MVEGRVKQWVREFEDAKIEIQAEDAKADALRQRENTIADEKVVVREKLKAWSSALDSKKAVDKLKQERTDAIIEEIRNLIGRRSQYERQLSELQTQEKDERVERELHLQQAREQASWIKNLVADAPWVKSQNKLVQVIEESSQLLAERKGVLLSLQNKLSELTDKIQEDQKLSFKKFVINAVLYCLEARKRQRSMSSKLDEIAEFRKKLSESESDVTITWDLSETQSETGTEEGSELGTSTLLPLEPFRKEVASSSHDAMEESQEETSESIPKDDRSNVDSNQDSKMNESDIEISERQVRSSVSPSTAQSENALEKDTLIEHVRSVVIDEEPMDIDGDSKFDVDNEVRDDVSDGEASPKSEVYLSSQDDEANRDVNGARDSPESDQESFGKDEYYPSEIPTGESQVEPEVADTDVESTKGNVRTSQAHSSTENLEFPFTNMGNELFGFAGSSENSSIDLGSSNVMQALLNMSASLNGNETGDIDNFFYNEGNKVPSIFAPSDEPFKFSCPSSDDDQDAGFLFNLGSTGDDDSNDDGFPFTLHGLRSQKSKDDKK